MLGVRMTRPDIAGLKREDEQKLGTMGGLWKPEMALI